MCSKIATNKTRHVMWRPGWTATLCAIITVPLAANAQVTFTKIADNATNIPCAGVSSETFNAFDYASLRNGKLAFHGSWTPTNSFEGLFLYSNGTLDTFVTTNSNCTADFPRNIGLASFDGGTVVYDAFKSGVVGVALVRQNGPDADVLLSGADAMPGSPTQVEFGNFADIAYSNGEITWHSQSGGGSTDWGVYTLGGAITTHAYRGDEMPPGSGSTETFVSFTSAVRDGNSIAYSGQSQFGNNVGIYQDTGSGQAVVVDSSTTRPGGTQTLLGIDGSIAMQNDDIAFIGDFRIGPSTSRVVGVYSTAGGLHTVADTQTPAPGGVGNFTEFRYNPGVWGGLAIHTETTVFMGTYENAGTPVEGIYVEYGGTIAKVIAVGDMLDGAAVQQLKFLREGFDGQSLAFVALLGGSTSSRAAVFLADGVGALVQPTDTDGDGVFDIDDAFPNDPNEWEDTDADGTGNNADLDDDNDGVPDTSDAWPLGRFTDVDPATHFAFAFIETLERSGITGGCGNDRYCPDDPVTRAQMAVFLERGMNGASFVPPPATGMVFDDVAAGDFAASFIEQLFADGITNGCSVDNYCPNDSVTRAQMAVFLLRAKYGAGYLPPPPAGVFNDVSVGDFADRYIEQLAAEGITSGCGNGNYCPDDPITRAQMAVFLVRTFGL